MIMTGNCNVFSEIDALTWADATKKKATPEDFCSPGDERDARITKIEAEVTSWQKQVADYGTLVEVMLADLLDLNQRYRNVKTERDMLAKRIQELLAPPPGYVLFEPADEPDPVFAAVEVHQKQGVR